MKVAAEYRQHAEECRKLAKSMPDSDAKQQLLLMAETWDRLAADREASLRVQPEEALSEASKD